MTSLPRTARRSISFGNTLLLQARHWIQSSDNLLVRMEGLKTTQINETPLQPTDLGNLEIISEYDETRALTRCRKCRIM